MRPFSLGNRPLRNLSCRFAVGLLLLMPSISSAQQPGLFFDREDVPKIRERFQSDPMFADLKATFENKDIEAEKKFMTEEVVYNDHLFHVARLSRFAQEMSFYYVFSGKREAADLAIQAVRTLMKFPIWDYFLDGDKVMGLQRASAAAIATSITVEFLGDLIDEDERTDWLKIMAERGIEPCYVATYGMRYPETVTGWRINPESTYFDHRPGDRGWDLSRWPYILDKNNLKSIPASAISIGALTYRRYFGESEDTKRWLEQATFSLASFDELFERDGSYEEGVSYAHYTTSHLLQGMIPIKRILGKDVTDIVNWPGYIEFLQQLTLPTVRDPYQVINFSDVGRGAVSSAAFWLADALHDQRAQWLGKNHSYRHDQWSLIWYNPEIPSDAPPARPEIYEADLDWIVGRTGYEAEDLVVALRSGGPMNHEHADRNSIILKAFGELLVSDPHRPPYSYTDPSWAMRHTIGHSGVLVDGEGHQYVDGSEGTNSSKAWAHIVRKGERATHLFWTSDATPGYRLVNADIKSLTRTVIVLHELPAVVLLDKLIKASKPSKMQARFFAFNNDGKATVEAASSGFRTTRPHARLLGFSAGKNGQSFKTGLLPIPEEKAKMYPFVEVSTVEEAMAPLQVTVLIPGKTGMQKPEVQFAQTANGLQLSVMTQGKEQQILVFDAGRIPEFKID